MAYYDHFGLVSAMSSEEDLIGTVRADDMVASQDAENNPTELESLKQIGIKLQPAFCQKFYPLRQGLKPTKKVFLQKAMRFVHHLGEQYLSRFISSGHHVHDKVPG